MAEVETTTRNLPEIVDLTLLDSDDDDKPNQFFPATQPSSLRLARSAYPVINLNTLNDGLLLPGAFGIPEPTLRSFRNLERRSSGRTAHIRERAALPLSPSNPAKRRRLNRVTPRNLRFFESSSVHAEPVPHIADRHNPIVIDDSDETAKGDLSEVLRKQVFPHINQCLRQYSRTLDDSTRKIIGRKTACAIRDDPSFAVNQRENNNSLSVDYERSVAEQCRTLVDKFANHAQADIIQRFGAVGSNGRRAVKTWPSPAEVTIESDSSSEDVDSDRSATAHINKSRIANRYSSSPTTSTTDTTSRFKSKAAQSHRSSNPYNSVKQSTKVLTPVIAEPFHTTKPKRKDAKQLVDVVDINGPHWTKPPELSLSEALLKHQAEELRFAGLAISDVRPYLSAKARGAIERGISLIDVNNASTLNGCVIHVDFCLEEKQYVNAIIDTSSASKVRTEAQLLWVLRYSKLDKGLECHALGQKLLQSRKDADISAFLEDASIGIAHHQQKIMRISSRNQSEPKKVKRFAVTVDSVLRKREMWGGHRSNNGRSHQSLKSKILSSVEDAFFREAEWTDCSGDIATITWLPENQFICGAVTHSDSHNQQYNKPGNLLLGSVHKKKLQSIPSHQIPRPLVKRGDNSLASMRETQDPWLYSSVTTTAYDKVNQKVYSGSYDMTVKVWNVNTEAQKSDMALCATWHHNGVVNFVVTSEFHGKVASAADVPLNAIRVYKLDKDNISLSPYDVYSGERAIEHSKLLKQTWAYYPATIQWGRMQMLSHFLLVGYSPRSHDPYDSSIPEDKINTGELCLWNTNTSEPVSILTSRTPNVFEVIWHPTQPIFIAATSPVGDHDDGVKTQVRLFGLTELGNFSHVKSLDCYGVDINEITVMPNSRLKCYVTASCTDGKTYVWDTAQDDKPIHILCHGSSIDDQINEDSDSGVKFAAWGKTVDRFYTGSSDGVVKAWNIRAPPGHEFVQDVVTFSGGVSSGQFSPDGSRLIIGDSTGKVHLLCAIDSPEPGDENPRVARTPITPHSEPERPSVENDEMDIGPEPTAKKLAQAFIDQGQIKIDTDEYVGAVQGDNYASTGLICPPEQHSSSWLEKRLERLCYERLELPRLRQVSASSKINHERNVTKGAKFMSLTPCSQLELEREGLDFNFETEYNFRVEDQTCIFDVQEKDVNGIEGMEIAKHFLNEIEIAKFQTLKRMLSSNLALLKTLDNIKSS